MPSTNAVGKAYDSFKEDMEHYQLVSLVTYDELWELWANNPMAKGLPEFFCVIGQKIHCYPAFDTKKHWLMCRGKGKDK